jgi:hypothetical protein
MPTALEKEISGFKNHQINLMINCSLGSTPETQMDSFVNHELIKSKDIFV